MCNWLVSALKWYGELTGLNSSSLKSCTAEHLKENKNVPHPHAHTHTHTSAGEVPVHGKVHHIPLLQSLSTQGHIDWITVDFMTTSLLSMLSMRIFMHMSNSDDTTAQGTNSTSAHFKLSSDLGDQSVLSFQSTLESVTSWCGQSKQAVAL